MNNKLSRSFFLISTLIAIAAISGCSSSTSPSTSGSNGNGGGGLLLPPTIDFGVSPNGLMRDTSISIFNNNVDTTTITSDGLSSPAVRDTNFSRAVSIAPTQYKNFHFQFTPSVGVSSATDSIHYQSGGKNYTGVMTLEANGSSSTGGTGYFISVPSNVNFGTLPIGQWHDTTITLVNSGSAPVIITSDVISSGEGQDTNFAQPKQVAANSIFTIHIQFNPAQAGARSATDQINYTSGGTNSSLTVSLNATGSATSTGGKTPGPGSTFTYAYTSVDTNGVTSPTTDSTYTVVSNTLTYQGKTNVLEVRDGSGGLAYYHFESNGDISVYVDLSSIPFPVSVSTNWFIIPIGSGIEQQNTLFDTTETDPTGTTQLPVTISITTDAKNIGAATITAAGRSFACVKGSLTITASVSALNGLLQLYSLAQTSTISYSKVLGYYPERQDIDVNSGSLQSSTTNSDTYLLKSYTVK